MRETGWVVAWPSDRKVSAASVKLVEAIQSEINGLNLEESLRRVMGHPVAPKPPAARKSAKQARRR